MDERTRMNLEKVSHTISRSRLLEKAAKVTFATAAALALGTLGTRTVLAAIVGCCCGGEPDSKGCGSGCPAYTYSGDCPSGLHKCTNSNCTYCNYNNAVWTCYCGGAPVLCVDCWNGSNCTTACTCAETLL